MSVVHERGALDRPITLLAHARRLHRSTPDGALPDGGRPFPDDGHRPRVAAPDRQDALAAVLRDFIDNPAASPADLHARCADLHIRPWDVTRVVKNPAPGCGRPGGG